MPLERLLANLPWQVFFQATYLFRRFVFSKDADPVEMIRVEGHDADDLRELLFDEGLVRGDLSSLYYYGEDVNMVGGVYKDDEYEWYQYHVRGFDREDGTWLRPHTELYWRVYPKEHVRLVNLSVEEGIAVTERILDGAGIAYEVVPEDRVAAVDPIAPEQRRALPWATGRSGR